MPLTALDAATALIVIDLQKGLDGYPTVEPMTEIVRRTNLLIAAFRAKDLPIILVHATGVPPGRTQQPRPPAGMPEGFADFHSDLAREPGDHVVEKRSWGAFTHTGLSEHLASLGTTQIVLAGVATSIGVESTARQAHELGLNVTLAADAMTDLSAESHEHSVTRIFPRLGEVATVAEIAHHLGQPQA